jgi:hypothetical protein
MFNSDAKAQAHSVTIADTVPYYWGTFKNCEHRASNSKRNHPINGVDSDFKRSLWREKTRTEQIWNAIWLTSR